MDWINTVNGLIALISGLVGLVGTCVGAFFAVKGWLKAFKEKSAAEKWALIQQIADAAMESAEKSGKSGVDKKNMVIDAVKEGCKAAGINMGGFIDQLINYIDQSIAFVNGMTK